MKNKKKIIINIFLLILLFSLTGLFTACSDDMCWVCCGAGKCYECSGKIAFDADACYVCKGTKKCFNCNGRGKVQTEPRFK